MKKNIWSLLWVMLLIPGLVWADGPAVAPHIDSGNTAWLLTSSALVMLMTPGLAFFYAGMVNKKNVVSTLLQNYIALALVGLIWVVIGYSLVFTENNGFIGGAQYFMLKGLPGTIYEAGNVPNMAFMAFQMMFAIITPALITGAFAERVKFKAWLFIMALACVRTCCSLGVGSKRMDCRPWRSRLCGWFGCSLDRRLFRSCGSPSFW